MSREERVEELMERFRAEFTVKAMIDPVVCECDRCREMAEYVDLNLNCTDNPLLMLLACEIHSTKLHCPVRIFP